MYTLKYHNPALMGETITTTFDTEEKLKSFMCWLITAYPVENILILEITKAP